MNHSEEAMFEVGSLWSPTGNGLIAREKSAGKGMRPFLSTVGRRGIEGKEVGGDGEVHATHNPQPTTHNTPSFPEGGGITHVHTALTDPHRS